jgi:D-3-phosphoglycerate dehydrogenase / 2-oxoglutarate reductase
MPKVKTYNKIAKIGLDRFTDKYQIGEDIQEPDAIILRSFDLHNETIPDSVLAVGRAGAGVNNVPVEELTKKGVVVFNAPGGNANSVKELVLCALFLAARNVPEALEYTKNLPSENLKEQVEAGKKQFAGTELSGKTLGVIGLGAIGHKVANSGIGLGMKVYGYDPAMTVQNAWQLSPSVQQVEDINELFKACDYVSIHVPLIDPTKGMINTEKIANMKQGAVLINFSRDKIVDETALLKALDEGKIARYVTDFPNETVKGHPKVTALPHLGASTLEAEDNCAIMVADQLQHYLKDGNIKHSVNFPKAKMARSGGVRITLAHTNEPGMIARITSILAEDKINISELFNNNRGDLAYTIVDLDTEKIDDSTIKKLESIEHLIKLRVI